MDAQAALAFVREQGVVLASAKGPVPTLTWAIVGEQIKGSWWGHREGKRIFAVLQLVCDDPEVLVCRLVEDKLTLVHRRLWPALAAAAPDIPAARLCRVMQVHTAQGRHINRETPFPDWLPLEASIEARSMTVDAARAALGQAFVTNRGSRKTRD